MIEKLSFIMVTVSLTVGLMWSNRGLLERLSGITGRSRDTTVIPCAAHPTLLIFSMIPSNYQ